MGKILSFLAGTSILCFIIMQGGQKKFSEDAEVYDAKKISELSNPYIEHIRKPKIHIVEYDDADLECLALNLYHEARGESDIEILSVAQVTLNRVISEQFPDTICEVVYQPYQFSWTMKHNRVIDDWKTYRRMKKIAQGFLNNKFERTVVGDANHYHHKSISPKWSKYGKNKIQLVSHVYMEIDS